MKKSVKKKYDNLKADGSAYAELASEYERGEMADYSFKNRSQAMGKNAKKIRTRKIIRIVLSVIGAVLVLYIGYFIIALIKGINSRPQTTTAEYVLDITEQEDTTLPSTTEPQTTTRSATVEMNRNTSEESL